MNHRLCIMFLAAACMPSCGAQTQNYLYGTGDQSWGINLPIESGYINVANGEIHLEIPLATHKQRGDLSLDEKLVYDSRIWQLVADGSSVSFQPTNVPNSMAGWRFVAGNETGNLQSITQVQTPVCYENNTEATWYYYWFNWTDPSGAVHQFPLQTQELISNPCYQYDGYNPPSTPTASGYAADGSGYYMAVTNYTSATVYDSNGDEVYPSVVDRNGNYFSTDGNGNLVDTLGRTPVVKTSSGSQIYYDVLTIGGATKRYTITTEQISVSTAFGQSGANDYSGTLTAIQSIQLPDGSTYQFSYDSAYGEMTGITLPTGGSVSLGWENYQDSYQDENRWLGSYSGGRGNYSFSPQVVTQCSGPSDTGCQEQMTVWHGNDGYAQYLLTLNNGAWNSQVDFYTGTSHYLSAATTYDFSTSCQWYECAGSQWITASKIIATLSDTSQTAETSYSYQYPWIAKPTVVNMWDYGVPVTNTPSKETEYTYGEWVNGAAFPTQVTQFYQGTEASQITYNYDGGSLTQTSGLPNHSSVAGARGNLTSVNAGSDVSVTTSSTYDDTGTKLSDTDGNTNTTTYTSMCSDAYRQTVKYPVVVSGQNLETTTTYDCSSGLVTAKQDMNGVVNNLSTIYSYFTSGAEIGKLHTIAYPDGGSAAYSYPSTTETEKTVAQSSSVSQTTETILDSYGRKYQSVVVAPEGLISTETEYGSDGWPSSVTNPHIGGTVLATNGTTYYNYDILGRVNWTEEPDGSYIESTYSGPTETVKNEDGYSKSYTYDAFHRLITVMEPNPSGTLAYETDYQYDGLDKLTQIDQWGGAHGASGDRQRKFVYDSLGRLKSSTTPEAGVTAYSYDGNGNALTKTDARSVVATYGYDGLNRVTSMTYSSNSNGTATSCFQYDTSSVNGAGQYLIGHLTNEWTQSASAGSCAAALPASGYLTLKAVLSYDAMGRQKSVEQCTPSNCASTTPYSLAYGYDLAGNLTSYTNGLSSTPGAGSSPLTFTNGFDEAGRLQSTTSSWSDAQHPSALFGAQSYMPPGSLANATYGNGLTVSRSFDKRLRITGETDTGATVNSATSGTATVAITGAEQSQ